MESKYEQILKQFGGNSDVVIVSHQQENLLPNSGFFSHFVYLYVAPKTGIYTAGKLQEFMLSLAPELRPQVANNFIDYADEIERGRLFFDEDIGTERIHREIILTDKSMFPSEGFVNGKASFEQTKKLCRRVIVDVFPDRFFAEDAIRNGMFYRIDKADLKKHLK